MKTRCALFIPWSSSSSRISRQESPATCPTAASLTQWPDVLEQVQQISMDHVCCSACLCWCPTRYHHVSMVSLCRLDFINAAWTPYHAVEEASKRLMAAGFTHIAEKDAWNLKPGMQAAAALCALPPFSQHPWQLCRTCKSLTIGGALCCTAAEPACTLEPPMHAPSQCALCLLQVASISSLAICPPLWLLLLVRSTSLATPST